MVDPMDDWKARREDFRQEVDIAATPLRHEAIATMAHGVSYAQIGLKWGFLLNGGALIALPALIEGLPGVDEAQVQNAALCYIVGLLFLGICSIVSYYNFERHAARSWACAGRATWSAMKVIYATEQMDDEAQAEIDRFNALIARHEKAVWWTYIVGPITGSIGFVCFIAGSVILIL